MGNYISALTNDSGGRTNYSPPSITSFTLYSIPDVPENRFPRRIEPLLCPRLSLVNSLARARCREPSRVCNVIIYISWCRSDLSLQQIVHTPTSSTQTQCVGTRLWSVDPLRGSMRPRDIFERGMGDYNDDCSTSSN